MLGIYLYIHIVSRGVPLLIIRTVVFWVSFLGPPSSLETATEGTIQPADIELQGALKGTKCLP